MTTKIKCPEMELRKGDVPTECRCKSCGKLISKEWHKNNFCKNCDEDFDEATITDCPKCNKTYDDADADFLICHHCGYNAHTGKTDQRKRSGINRLGLDPDANDVWY